MPLFGSLYRLFTFLVRYTRHVKHAHLLGAGILVASVASGLANTALIAVVNQVINADRPGRASQLLLFLGICLVFPLMRYLGDSLLINLTEKATLHLRLTLCTRMLAVPLRRLEELGASRLTATLLNDLPSVIGAMTLIPLLCMNVTVVLGCLTMMGILSWKMLLGVLLFLVVGAVAYQLPLLRGHGHIQALREKADELYGHFRALIEGIKELKLHDERRRAFLEERVQGTAVQVQNHSVAAHRAFSSAVSWGQVLVFLLIGVVAFGLPAFTPVSRSVLTGYTFAILYMVGPIQVIMNSMAQLSRAVTAMDRVEQMGLKLADAARPTSAPAPAALTARPAGWSLLELDGVTHTYYSERDRSNFTLGPIDLAFRPGEIVFVTGGNGSGKTTLAKLLIGLYAPETGEVRLDGRPVGDAELERYHSLFSAVFSDFYLFDTLLGLGRAGLDADARHYLQELQLDHKVTVEDGRLSSTDLSQGQRKRLALLTAYLEDRPIYLFDEWAADQDPHFKDVFYHELLPRLRERGKTVFAISHDDRYYSVADRLIKLDYGQVVHDSRQESILPVEVTIAPAAEAVANHA
jgi:putative ATP-binding cassette transporter